MSRQDQTAGNIFVIGIVAIAIACVVGVTVQAWLLLKDA